MKNTIAAWAAGATLALAATVATAGSGGSQVGRPTWDATHAGSKLDVSTYSLVWGDEFDGSKITANTGPGPWYAPVHANMSLGVLQAPPSDVYSVQYGVLHMKTILSGTTWKTSNIQSTNSKMQGFTLQNGYWEVRAKMPSGYGCWSSIWLLSSALDTTKPHAELDVIEFYGQDDYLGIHSTSHVWSAPNPQPGDPTDHWWLSTYTKEPDLATKFHTYGVLLDASKIVIYFDGVELKRIARTTEQQVPMYLLLTNMMNAASAQLDAGEMQVDYVRVYAPKAAARSTPDAVQVADALQVSAPAATTALATTTVAGTAVPAVAVSTPAMVSAPTPAATTVAAAPGFVGLRMLAPTSVGAASRDDAAGDKGGALDALATLVHRPASLSAR